MAGQPEFPLSHDMRAEPSCDELADDLASYVWGALDPEARARIDHHRMRCLACDRWLRESEQVVSQLDQALPRIAPPPALRSRVLDVIDTLPRRAVQAANPDHPRAGAAVQPIRSAAHARPRQRGSGWRASPFLAGLSTGLVGACAAAALIIVLVVRPQALSMLSPTQSEFGSSEPGSPQVRPGPLPRGGATSARLVELRSTSQAGHGWLVLDADARRSVLLVQGLAPTAGSEYTVSIVQAAQRVELGKLTVDARGVGTFVLPEPLPLDHPERIEVAPTGQDGPDERQVISGEF